MCDRIGLTFNVGADVTCSIWLNGKGKHDCYHLRAVSWTRAN